jgi:hypothetical protein
MKILTMDSFSVFLNGYFFAAIRFDIPRNMYVKIVIYDILGKEVLSRMVIKSGPALIGFIGINPIIQIDYFSLKSSEPDI